MTSAGRTKPFVRYCPDPDCGKKCFETRRDARALAKKLKDRGRLHAYRHGDYWHIGHLPSRVKAGDKTRDQIEPTRKTPR